MTCGIFYSPGRPPRLANSRLFAERALSVLAAPELADYFNMRDYRVQAALLACPYGTGLQPGSQLHGGGPPPPAGSPRGRHWR